MIADRDLPALQPTPAPAVPAPSTPMPSIYGRMFDAALSGENPLEQIAALEKICDKLAQTDFVPAAFKGKGGNVMAAIELGRTVGLDPIPSLQWIAVINGRPSLWGDALPAIVKRRGGVITEREIGTNGKDDWGYECRVSRPDHTDVVRSFTVADAKRAGLHGKQGPWKNYTARMLQMRARGFAVRDQCPDWLNGMIAAEEASDIIDITDRAEVVREEAKEVESDQTRSQAVLERLEGEQAPDAEPTVEEPPAQQDDNATGDVVESDDAPAKPQSQLTVDKFVALVDQCDTEEKLATVQKDFAVQSVRMTQSDRAQFGKAIAARRKGM